jgi:hypothetical protein
VLFLLLRSWSDGSFSSRVYSLSVGRLHALLYYGYMLQTPELADAIENLYRVFQHYELRSNTDACTCHHTPEDEQRLHGKPLSKLSCDDLRDYAMDAVYTWGTGDDFKHFIPRLFELLAQASGPGDNFVDAASVFAKLTYDSWCSCSWRTWPESEQRALSNYFLAVWDAALDSDPEDLSFNGAYGWLAAIAQAEHDLTRYFDRWLGAPSVNAHQNLALMITQEGLPRTKNMDGGYWAKHREQWEQLNDWLRRPEVRQKLADAFERWVDSPFAGQLMDAAILLP